MKTFFSKTDEDSIESFDLEKSEDNWFLSVVVNHVGNLEARIDVFAPFRYTLDSLDWDIQFFDPALSSQLRAEIAQKVTKVVYVPYGEVNWREVLRRMKKKNGEPQRILLPGDTV